MKSTPDLSRRDFSRRVVTSAAGAWLLGSTTSTRAAGESAAAGVLRGVWRTTHNPMALRSPAAVPAGETWRYMLGYVFQLAPRVAALSLNIKVTPGPGQDFPIGVDFLLFDDLGNLDPANALPFLRNHVEPNPNADNKPAIMAKYPPQIGFIPFGTKRADGTPHPHSGTGIASLAHGARPMDDSEGLDDFPDRVGRGAFRGKRAYRVWEYHQLNYDGSRLAWSPPRRWPAEQTIEGYLPSGPFSGMSFAIPDEDDLLMPVSARKPESPKGVSGILRWRRQEGMWHPIAFTPVTPEDNAIEPSLVRDLDGGLLFLARGRRETGSPVRIWRQAPGSSEWKLVIHRERLTNSTPISLNTAVDGTPFVLLNLYQPEFKLPPEVHSDGGVSRLEPKGWRGERSTICLHALNETRDGFVTPLIVRDPLVDHGVPPRGTIWAADHPIATVVQLRDGGWHCIFGYRMLEWIENTHQSPPSAETGCYLDEVISLGPPVAPWRF